jgi:transposase
VCCSVLSSTSSMGRSGELSDFERGLVIGCHISEKSVRYIATFLKLPKSVVGDVIVKWKHEGTTTMKPQPGRLHLKTNRDHQALNVVYETRQTLSETIIHEFCSATNCPGSTMTVYRELRGMRFHGRTAAHKPNISPMNVKREPIFSAHWFVAPSPSGSGCELLLSFRLIMPSFVPYLTS